MVKALDDFILHLHTKYGVLKRSAKIIVYKVFKDICEDYGLDEHTFDNHGNEIADKVIEYLKNCIENEDKFIDISNPDNIVCYSKPYLFCQAIKIAEERKRLQKTQPF